MTGGLETETPAPADRPVRARGASAAGPLARIRGARPATLLLAAAVLLSGGLLLNWLSDVTFWRDEWAFLLHRRGSGVDVFLNPFVEQLLAIPIAIYKVLVTTFGMESPLPFQIVSTTLFLLSAVLLFVYLRRRVGEWLALAAVLPLLVLGAAWDDLLFPFQMSFFGSMSCGLGALLALDRGDRRGDLLATALLTVSLFFSDLGIPFVAGAALEIGFDRDRLWRAYVVAIPTAAFGLWYLGWGHEAQHFISLHNFLTLPSYILDGLSSSLSALLGLAAPRDEIEITPLDWGRPLLVVAIGLGAWRLWRLGRVSPRLACALVIGIGFWTLVGLNASIFGAPSSGRYLYIGVIFLLLIAAELLRGVRLGRTALIVAFVVAGAATLANFSNLKDAAGGLAGIAVRERAGLAALELTRGRVDPAFELNHENSDVDYIDELDAGSYFAAVDDYGSPAYTPAELAEAPEVGRVAADKVFAAALGVSLAPDPGAVGNECTIVRPGSEPAVVDAPPGGAVLRAGEAGVDVRLRRYASASFPVDAGALSAGVSTVLDLPSDASNRPWQLELTGAGPVAVCAHTADGA